MVLCPHPCVPFICVGDSVVSGKISGRGDQNLTGGVSGFKKLGVKEMTYRMLFVACAVQFSDHRTGGPGGVPIQPDTGKDRSTGADGSTEQETAAKFSEAEMQQVVAMRQTPQLYLRMVESVCPSIFGHLEVKRGILLMLFGGVHKVTSEGISLRGDINVCIVGDPSVAKSQFLKYVHSFLPRTVYTSGKSSSAAGLTASVVRDNETGEFCVEAGALMLADNGICCIDEFDKVQYMTVVDAILALDHVPFRLVFTHSLIHLFIYSFIQSFIYSFIFSFIHSFISYCSYYVCWC